MKSNIAQWKVLQADGYFDKHALYGDAVNDTTFDVEMIERFRPLTPDMTVVVIGCGYGRESVHIGRRVAHVYGVDVSELILDRAVEHTRRYGVTNFTPVLAEAFATAIPPGVDVVFSHVVFQHLTRDLGRNYLQVLADKLAPGGSMLIQFCEDFLVDGDNDADLEVYEPSVSYSMRQIIDAAAPRLILREARSVVATPSALWHWADLIRDPARAPPPPPRRTEGNSMINVDLTADYQSYPNKSAEQPGAGVSFSTGSTPWAYVAAIGLGLGGDVRAESLDVVIEAANESVFLMVVDKAYTQVGERTEVTARGVQRVRVALPSNTYSLVVQAGQSPAGASVTLIEVVLNNAE